jgi:HAD superfamily hydrolase (TIGR01509 family)
LVGFVLKALLMDFDGTLWDSEDASFRSWQETYAEFGLTLSIEDFAPVIGTVGGKDLLSELELRARRPVNRKFVGERRRLRKLELLQSASPRPGVLDYLRDARELGLAVAIVSTDDTEWITEGLSILGLLEAWDFIECADGDVSRAKPSPALYLSALERLGIASSEAVAIEDSPNGIRAAKRARIFTLAVPNKITRFLDTSEADRIVMSLEELPLRQLVHDMESGGRPARGDADPPR